ncbi:hypothetical protein EDD15DRAFT_2202972 [Pisolithus albus]|nr:hypothetical protein EDD15DRAFT_2202972 [Pisolithus albus]
MLSAQYSVGDYTYTSVSHVRPYGLPRWVAVHVELVLHSRYTPQLFTPYYSSHTSFIKQCTHHILSYVMNNLTPLRDLAVARLLVGIDILAFTHWKLPSRGRPLSYAEILRRWTKAVIKRQRAIHPTEETQDEYEDSASDVIAVVGQDEYYKFLEVLSCALQQHWMIMEIFSVRVSVAIGVVFTSSCMHDGCLIRKGWGWRLTGLIASHLAGRSAG